MSKIEAMKNYILTYPGIEKLEIDFLDIILNSFSLSTNPEITVIRKYVDGFSIKEYTYNLEGRFSNDKASTLTNVEFFENFSNWITTNNTSKILPSIEGVNSVKCNSSGYLKQKEVETSIYEIKISLEVLEK